MKLPDPKDLCNRLAEAMRPQVTPDTVLVGIHTGGVWVAECLHGMLGLVTPLGSVDTGYHRDDHRLGGSLKAGGRPSHLPFDVEGAHLVIVDDVLYTGRTIRAAMNELFDYGRPARVDLAVLVDRGGRELPVAATWCPHAMDLPASRMLVLEKEADGTLAFSLSEK
ncbi:MAG: bifunctional pyr operon transcriptional regulator/uracil phosphoribosyltransferase PyrR [Rhodocyclaceae bacterium]|nr:bifunctional pyr operon transcriptional regulator/uracil phosphoribosyltransferase PyrR [Rhodocyclaceae bacterium]